MSTARLNAGRPTDSRSGKPHHRVHRRRGGSARSAHCQRSHQVPRRLAACLQRRPRSPPVEEQNSRGRATESRAVACHRAKREMRNTAGVLDRKSSSRCRIRRSLSKAITHQAHPCHHPGRITTTGFAGIRAMSHIASPAKRGACPQTILQHVASRNPRKIQTPRGRVPVTDDHRGRAAGLDHACFGPFDVRDTLGRRAGTDGQSDCRPEAGTGPAREKLDRQDRRPAVCKASPTGQAPHDNHIRRAVSVEIPRRQWKSTQHVFVSADWSQPAFERVDDRLPDHVPVPP